MTATPTLREGMSLDEFLEQTHTTPFDLIGKKRHLLLPETLGESEIRIAIFRAIIETHGMNCAWMKTTYIRPATDDPDWVIASRTPDVMVYAGDQIEQFKAAYPDYRERPLPVVPDLVVEVVSLNDKIVELDTKIEAYLADGVRLIWVIYPHSRKAIIYAPDAEQPRHLNINGILDGEEVLPGFQLPIAKIFD